MVTILIGLQGAIPCGFTVVPDDLSVLSTLASYSPVFTPFSVTLSLNLSIEGLNDKLKGHLWLQS